MKKVQVPVLRPNGQEVIGGSRQSETSQTAPSKTARADHPVRRARRAVLRETAANGRNLG